MMDIDELFEGLSGYADAAVRTDGRGRLVAAAGLDLGDADLAIRMDLLLDAASQLGASWEAERCDLMMLFYAGRVVVLASLGDGGHFAVVAKPSVAPGLLLSHVRRLTETPAAAATPR